MMVEKIRSSLSDRLGSSSNAARELKKVFAEIDEDGNGKLSFREFRSAMRDLRVRFIIMLILSHPILYIYIYIYVCACVCVYVDM